MATTSLAAARAITAAQVTHDRTGSDLRSYSASYDAARGAGAEKLSVINYFHWVITRSASENM